MTSYLANAWLVSVPKSVCRVVSCRARSQIPLERHKRVCYGLVTDFVATMSRWLKVRNFMICVRDFHRLYPRLSWFVSPTFTETSPKLPRGEVSVKVGVMEFGLYHAQLIARSKLKCCLQGRQTRSSYMTSVSMLAIETVDLLTRETPNFIPSTLWLPFPR